MAPGIPPSSMPSAIPFMVPSSVLWNLGRSVDGDGPVGWFIIGAELSGVAVAVAAGGAGAAVSGVSAVADGARVSASGGGINAPASPPFISHPSPCEPR